MKKLLLILLLWCGLAQGAAVVPNTFATMPAGNVAASTLDTNFALLANLNTFNNYYVDSGAANVYVVTTAAGTTATYTAGLLIQFYASNANTGSSTINVNALGAKNILNADGSALSGGQIAAGGVYAVVYNGTAFQLLGGTLRAHIGTFTRDLTTASGTQNVTGIGFTPTQVFMMGAINGSTVVSFGLDDGTTHGSVFNDYQDIANSGGLLTTFSVIAVTAVGNTFQQAKITALASDQFTLTWTKTGSPPGTITMFYLALGR